MVDKKEMHGIVLSAEQLEALALELIPSMLEFFESEHGKILYAEHLKRNEASQADKAA